MNVRDYLELPYNIIIRYIKDDSGSYYFAKVQELEGCMSDGKTIEEVHVNILEAMDGWIESRIEAGFDVPMPVNVDKYSGKFVIRLPKSLHARLAVEAEREGVSLNQYTLYKLAH